MSLLFYAQMSILAFTLTYLLLYPIRHLAINLKYLDYPDSSRKFQTKPVPYLGGVAILISVVIVFHFSNLYLLEKSIVTPASNLFLLPILLLGIIGLFDDLYQVSAPIRLILQFILASILTLILSSNSLLAKLFEIEILNSVVSILWIVVITNSINFIDNMDTSSAGNIILISLGIFVIAYQQFQVVISLLSIVVIGSVIAFLIWNNPPAKIYMGDSGTLFLGSILSIMSIRLDFLDEFPIESLTIILALFFVPILDFIVAITSRVIDGVSPFTAGQDHLSHRLVKLGFSKKKSVLILWALSAIAVSIGLIINNLNLSLSRYLIISIIFLYIILSIFFIKIKVR